MPYLGGRDDIRNQIVERVRKGIFYILPLAQQLFQLRDAFDKLGGLTGEGLNLRIVFGQFGQSGKPRPEIQCGPVLQRVRFEELRQGPEGFLIVAAPLEIIQNAE